MYFSFYSFSILFLLLPSTFPLTLIFTHSPNNFCASSRSPFFRNSLASHHVAVKSCCFCFLWISSNCSFAVFYLFYFSIQFLHLKLKWKYDFLTKWNNKEVQVQSFPIYGHQLTTFSRLLWLIIWTIFRIIWPYCLPRQVLILLCLDKEDACEFHIYYHFKCTMCCVCELK